jgi:hypothetical protein
MFLAGEIMGEWTHFRANFTVMEEKVKCFITLTRAAKLQYIPS